MSALSGHKIQIFIRHIFTRSDYNYQIYVFPLHYLQTLPQ